jgi:hypothetical protein
LNTFYTGFYSTFSFFGGFSSPPITIDLMVLPLRLREILMFAAFFSSGYSFFSTSAGASLKVYVSMRSLH